MSYDKPLECSKKWQEGSNTRIKFTLDAFKRIRETKISIMSFNIKNNQDNFPGRSWNDRKQAVLQLLKSKNSDFIALQEAEYEQFRYLDTFLDTYQSYGRGCGKKNEDGDFVPIYWNFVKWKLMEADVLWLSSTPQVPGTSDKAASKERVITWCIFKHFYSDFLI